LNQNKKEKPTINNLNLNEFQNKNKNDMKDDDKNDETEDLT
jgi:hypothetical protein